MDEKPATPNPPIRRAIREVEKYGESAKQNTPARKTKEPQIKNLPYREGCTVMPTPMAPSKAPRPSEAANTPTGNALRPKVSRPITGRMFPKGKPNALTMTVIIKTPRPIGSLRA